MQPCPNGDLVGLKDLNAQPPDARDGKTPSSEGDNASSKGTGEEEEEEEEDDDDDHNDDTPVAAEVIANHSDWFDMILMLTHPDPVQRPSMQHAAHMLQAYIRVHCCD